MSTPILPEHCGAACPTCDRTNLPEAFMPVRGKECVLCVAADPQAPPVEREAARQQLDEASGVAAMGRLKAAYQSNAGSGDGAATPGADGATGGAATGDGTLEAVLFSGQRVSLAFDASRNVAWLKERIEVELGVARRQQRLLLDGRRLDDDSTRLGAAGVRNGTTVLVVVKLLDVAASVKDLTLHLGWGFPATGQDFLDGSGLAYAGARYVGLVDYSNVDGLEGASHSGDLMHATGGRHELRLQFDKLPPDVDAVYLTLSAWTCGSLALFRAPTVRVFDTEQPEVELTQYQVASAGGAQAVVMAAVRREEGSWRVLALGRVSGGNAKDYEPLRATIAGLANEMG